MGTMEKHNHKCQNCQGQHHSTTKYVKKGIKTLDDDLEYNDLWEPWKNIITSVKTTKANITRLQNMLKREQKPIINTDTIAKALDKRGILRHTITIQIASNNNFIHQV